MRDYNNKASMFKEKGYRRDRRARRAAACQAFFSIFQPYRLFFISEAEAEVGESASERGEKEKSPSLAFNALSLPCLLCDHVR